MHRAWKAARSPLQGDLFEQRKVTRNIYHDVLKEIQADEERLRAERMMAKLTGSGFWSEVKAVLGTNKPNPPTTVGDAQGDEAIAEVFREKYHDLYNSVPYESDELERISEFINQRIIEQEVAEADHFTGADVERAVRKLKKGKTDGVSECMSDHFMHGTHLLFFHMANLFVKMLYHGHVPNQMKLSTLIPIPKNKRKSMNDPGNYRAIALSSILGKILDHSILLKHAESLSTCDLQFGFKKSHSTVQCTYVVNEVVHYYNRHNSDVYAVLLDASQAFDRVHYCKLFALLLKRNLSPVICHLLLNMYCEQCFKVQWGKTTTESSTVTNGVKQGGVLSPILFTVYVDEMMSRLEELKIGCHLGHRFCGALGYADDVILLSPTITSMKLMLNCAELFANEYHVKFNPSKSSCLFFLAQRSIGHCLLPSKSTSSPFP